MSRRLALPLLVLALAACGDGASSGATLNPPPPPPPPPPPVQEPTAVIRLRGVAADPAAYASYLVDVAHATVLVDGEVVADVTGPGPIDLMRPDHAWPLARFEEPMPGQTVEVRLTLGPGSAATLATPDGGEGAMDARPGELRFRFPSVRLGARHHAVIHLDLDRSRVTAGEGARALVPQYVVYF